MFRFLLISVNIESIIGEVTIGLRRKKLEEMAQGNGLNDAYGNFNPTDGTKGK